MDKVAVPMIDHARMAAAIVDNIVKRFESSLPRHFPSPRLSLAYL